MKRVCAVVAALLALTGCGTTLQMGSQGAAGDASLGTAGSTGGAPGLSVPSGAGGTANDGLPTGNTGSVGGAGASVAGGAGGGATSSGGPGGSGAVSPAPRGPAARSSQHPAVTGPIEIGFLNTKTGNAAAFGLNVGQTYQPSDIFLAAVKAMNAHGGLAGRRIVPLVADTDTASANWGTDYQAACAKFTQDNHVAAVLGYSFAFEEAFEACLAKAGVPHLTGGYSVGDSTSYAQFPYLFSTTAPTADRRYYLQLDAAVRSGYLTPKSKLGLLLDQCPFDQRAYQRTVYPYISQHHLHVTATATIDCTPGAGDDGNTVSQIESAELAFRSKGVDRVFIEGVPLVVFAQEAQQQHWYPGYLVTSATGGGAVESNVPAQQAANVHGAGWMPEVDVDPSNQPPKTPAERRCLQLLASQGIRPQQYNDFVSAYTTCDGLALYALALQHTRGDSTAAAVKAAITSLGSTFQAASTYGAATYFTSSRRDAPAAYRLWGWNQGCRCFRYYGSQERMP